MWKITQRTSCQEDFRTHVCTRTCIGSPTCVCVCVCVCVGGGVRSTQLLLGDGAFSFSLCLFGVSRKSLGGEGCGGHVGRTTVCTHC